MAKMETLLLLLVSLVAGSFGQSSYCQICTDHTMCIYQQQGNICQPLLKSGVSQSDINVIVAAHNELRARVANGLENKGSNGGQPPAADMRQLTWDQELANIAQRWANQCNYGHDACRKVQRFGVGQNAALSWSTSPNFGVDWKGTVQSWYNEVSLFDKNNISPFKFSMPTGHYTAVVWAKTNKVGCGYARFQKAGDSNYYNYYVCNYGEAGNFRNAAMYQVGAKCSKCPVGTAQCLNGLCV